MRGGAGLMVRAFFLFCHEGVWPTGQRQILESFKVGGVEGCAAALEEKEVKEGEETEEGDDLRMGGAGRGWWFGRMAGPQI
jgi:hypothetical protein